MVTFLRNVKECSVPFRSLGYHSNPKRFKEIKNEEIIMYLLATLMKADKIHKTK